MKIKISLVSLLLAFAMFSFAQEAKTYSDVAGIKTVFKPNKTWDNWFIQLGAGGQMFLGEEFKTDAIGDAISFPALNLSIGKWWTPYWGFRIKAQDAGMFIGDFKDFSNGRKMKSLNAHLDAMWNMSQYFGKYNAKKVFNFIPYAGIGWYMRDKTDVPQNEPGLPQPTRTFEGDCVHGVTINGGLLLNFRLSNHVGFHIDLGAAMTPDDKINFWQGGKAEAVASATAGFTFNLGKTYFEVFEQMDQDLINSLNKKINDLREENELLSKRPVKCDPCPQAPVYVAPPAAESNYILDNIVLFRINSTVIDANQRINIFNTAKFVKDTGEKIKVVGYADKKTGNTNINLKLSEQRAKAVAKELISKYGVPSDKIVVEWKGDNEQPFKDNEWNRVVIMKAQ